jgi:hypothetical protein
MRGCPVTAVIGATPPPGLLLQGDVVARVAPVGDGPAFRREPSVQVLVPLEADRDHAAVVIGVGAPAGDGRTSDAVGESERGLLPAVPRPVVRIDADLRALGRADAMQADAITQSRRRRRNGLIDGGFLVARADGTGHIAATRCRYRP